VRRRLGVFGGTFDPPHLGHLIVAIDALERLELDRVLLVPAADPPHKPSGAFATAGQRLARTRAAVAGDPRFEVDDLEIRRGGVSFTVDTLRSLRDRQPDAELYLLIGYDQFRSFATWREPAEIARLARLAVLARSGETVAGSSAYGELGVPVTRIDISSTEIRRRVAAGLSIRYFVPGPVRSIIEEDGLYRDRNERQTC
jgi:nicotinate-nucleotide adenylyltransferase